MFGHVEKSPAESANPPYISPPTAHPGYEPPNVHDGYDKFIQDILSDGHCDTFQSPRPHEDEKKESRIDQFIKWSGIAFAIAVGGTILKKAFQHGVKGAAAGMKEVAKEGIEHVV